MLFPALCQYGNIVVTDAGLSSDVGSHKSAAIDRRLPAGRQGFSRSLARAGTLLLVRTGLRRGGRRIVPAATAFRDTSALAPERGGNFVGRASLRRENVKCSGKDRQSRPYQPYWRQFKLMAQARRIATLIRGLENYRFCGMPQHFRGHMLLVRLGALTGGREVQPI
jgi:hypothetical protein